MSNLSNLSNLLNFIQNITTLIKAFYSSIIVSLIAVLVVSCASSSGGGGGGGGPTTRTSIFSHSSYAFLPLNTNLTAPPLGSPTPGPGANPTNIILLGSVLIKEAEINKLVAAEINKLITAEDSKVDANDISIINNYTIEYSFAGGAAENPSSTLNRYLTIESNSDSRGARIYANNPFAFPVSLTDILADIPTITVKAEITITVSSLVKVKQSLSRTVPVRFLEVVDTLPDVNDAVSFDLAKVSTKGGPVTPALMRNQFYTGSLSGSFANGTTAINGSRTLAFTSLWVAANASLATDPRAGEISPDNIFAISDLLNATETGIIQRITVTLTPEGASEFTYTYPAFGSSVATADAPVSIDILNGNSSDTSPMGDSLWKAISDESSNFTKINDEGIHVLNISIGWSFRYTYQRNFQPADTTLPDRFELNRAVLFAEEQAAITTIPIDGVNNALNRYGFAVAPGEQQTIFFALLNSSAARDPSSPSLPFCSPEYIYLDNIDTQVKSVTSFNYEDMDDEAERQFKCVLGASFNGADYQPLVARINATAASSSDSNPISGFTGCSTTEDVRCYYASLTINITNIDEDPTITYPPLSIAEGVGPVETDYPGVDFTTAAVGALSDNDAATGNLSVVRGGDITIADTDEVDNRTAKLPVNAAETKIVSIFPSHGNGLFSIVKQDGDTNLFNLRVNASELDYEKFVEEDDLNAEGKAIYMVTISTQDTDGAVANVKTMQVPVEIIDVRYAPVAVGISSLELGFTKAKNIANNSDGSVVLLSGAAMFANERNTLGKVKAVNPETGKDDELFYTVSYTADSSEPINNFAVVSGFGDGTNAQNLKLSKLGLTADVNDFTIDVQAFYRSVNFDRDNPADISDALSSIDASSNNVIGLETPISIDVAVDNTAYSNSSSSLYIDRAGLLDANRSPVFRVRQFIGSVTEDTAGDIVTGEARVNDSSGQRNLSFSDFYPNLITIPRVDDLDIPHEFALVGESGFGKFNAKQLLGITTHSSLFSINSTSGAISLKGESKVEFPDFYSVVVRLANADDIDKTANPFSHDYVTVNILVNDKNTAPEISKFNDFPAGVNGVGSYTEDPNALILNVTINENTPAGTVLARFTVTDDNDDMFAEHEFTFGAGIDGSDDFYEGAVKLTFTPADPAGKKKVSIATLTLVEPLNFEDFASTVIDEDVITITNDKVTLTDTSTILDKGRYEHNPLTQAKPEPVSVSPADDPQSASLAFNLVVLNVDEKPLIDRETSITIGEVMENAPQGSPVADIVINIANINETNADALVYELGDKKFDEVFDVNETADGVLQLIVADVDKLENLGDGLVHTSTLTITNNTGGKGPQDKSEPITIQVRVMDVLQPINFIPLNISDLQVAETDVDGDFSDGGSDAGGNRRHVIKNNLFVYKPTDVSKDADDFVRIGRRGLVPLVAISYAITDVSLKSSTPDDATDIDVTDGINFDTLSLLSLNAPDRNNNVGLAIDNTDYVEASLFGDLGATLTFSGAFIGGIVPPAINSIDFTVAVIKANPKNVEYDTTSNTAPVYTFEYTQNNYGDEITADNTGADAISASAIVSGGLPAEGARPQINLTGDTYNTALVRLSDDDVDNRYFIERDPTRALNKIKVTKDNQQQIDNAGVIVIPFTSNKSITVANIQILSADASGKLEDSADKFDSYFDIKVNNTYHFASLGASTGIDKVLLITQKQFAVINSSGVIDETIKYNALDTIPLFERETETTNRTYYIRVSQGDTPSNASNYALAQVQLNIDAAGLNIPAQITELYITTAANRGNRSRALADLTRGAATINENNITPNAFNGYLLNLSISNQDYETDNESTTTITIFVPTGVAPTPDSNIATNDQLIALSPEGGSNALPGANMMVVNQTGITGTYEMRFALARNVYGSAAIKVLIQENDSEGDEIDSVTHTFTLNVNEDTTSGDSNGNNAPTFTPLLRNVDGMVNVNSNNLDFNLTEDVGTEDIALLAIIGDTESKSIIIVPGDIVTNDNVIRNQAATIAVESVVRVDGEEGLSNTKEIDVFAYNSNIPNNTIMSYQKHGWGITNINYRVIETETRGFGNTVNGIIYDESITSRVTVAQVNDTAEFVNATPVQYNLNNFEQSSPGIYELDNNIAPKSFTLTYSDSDLKFATFSVGDAVPAGIIPGTPTSVPSTPTLPAALAITPNPAMPDEFASDSQLFTVSFMSDFNPLSEADYNAINALGDGAVYTIPFTGDNAADANASVRIAVDANDHTIGATSDGTFSLTDVITVGKSENFAVNTLSSIVIEDADFTRIFNEPETIIFSIDSAIEQVPDGRQHEPRDITNKITWQFPTVTTEKLNSIRIIGSTDADVGEYKITWSTRERYSAAGGPKTLTGSFIVDFTNALEELNLVGGNITIHYPQDGMGTLDSETNRTIATIDGINITGDDLNLPAELGYGILLTIIPENIDNEGVNSFTNHKNNEVSVIQFPGHDHEFTDDFALKYFISSADIMPGGTLPAFTLMVDDELAGDEFNIMVNATLAQSNNGETSGATQVTTSDGDTLSDGVTASLPLLTEYDIQSPPSDVSITLHEGGIIRNSANELVIDEARHDYIDVRFTDKNIEGGNLETFAGAPIDAFNATLVLYNSDKTEKRQIIEITNTNAFSYSGDTGNVKIYLPNANRYVGVNKFEITVTDNRTKDAPVVKLEETLNILGTPTLITDIMVATQLMTDIPGVTQELNYNNNDPITVLVNITNEDFVEGGGSYNLSHFSLDNFGFYMIPRGEDLTGTRKNFTNNTCSLGAIGFDKFEDITDTIADKTDEQKFLKFTIGVQELDRVEDVCARLDYDIIGTYFGSGISSGFNIQLSDGRPRRSIDRYHDSEGIVDRYTRTGTRNIAPIISNLLEERLEDVRYATGTNTSERTFTVVANFRDGDPDDGSDLNYALTSSNNNDCKIGDEFDNTIDTASWNIELREGTVVGDTCTLTLNVTEGDSSSIRMITIRAPKILIDFSGFISVTANENVISPPYDTGILAGDNVSISYGIQDNDGDGDTDVVFGDALSNSRKCKRVNTCCFYYL